MQAMSMRYVGEVKGLIITLQAHSDGQQAHERMMFHIKGAVKGTDDASQMHEQG